MLNLIYFSSPLEQFDIVVFLKTDLWVLLTNISIMVLFNYSLFLFFSYLFNNSFYMNNFQLFFRMAFNFVWGAMRDTITMKKFTFISIYYFIFIFIWFSNVLGMIPWSITVTSHLILTLSYALCFFIGSNIIGILYQKEKWFKLFLPDGVPIFIVPALFIIEVISYFARVVSLSVRLFANMLAGHILLKILIAFIYQILAFLTKKMAGFSIIIIIPFSLVFCVGCLELVIAFLQAYVFFILLNIYLNDVINLH